MCFSASVFNEVSANIGYIISKMCSSRNVFNEVSTNLRKRSGRYSFVQFKAALPPSEVNSWVVITMVVKSNRRGMNRVQ